MSATAPDPEDWITTVFAWASGLLVADVDSLAHLNDVWAGAFATRWHADSLEVLARGRISDLILGLPGHLHKLFPNLSELDSVFATATNYSSVLGACLLPTNCDGAELDAVASVAGALAWQPFLQGPEGLERAAGIFLNNPLAVFCWVVDSMARLMLPEWDPTVQAADEQDDTGPANRLSRGVRVVLSLKKHLGSVEWDLEGKRIHIRTGAAIAEPERGQLLSAVARGAELIMADSVVVDCDSRQHAFAEQLEVSLRNAIATIWQRTETIAFHYDDDGKWRQAVADRKPQVDVSSLGAIMQEMRTEIRGRRTRLVPAATEKKDRFNVVRTELLARLREVLKREPDGGPRR